MVASISGSIGIMAMMHAADRPDSDRLTALNKGQEIVNQPGTRDFQRIAHLFSALAYDRSALQET
jgi:hypothetical protein